MLEIKNLTKQFYQGNDEVTVIDDLSLTVKRGQIFGFLGPNGAGKTTTVKLITGLLFADKGTIKISTYPHHQLEAKKIIGFMSENPQFYHHLKAREVLEFVGALFALEPEILVKKIPKLLKIVGLEKSGDLIVRKFSKGMHQRLAFAAALVNDPELLILDEPLDGLDPLGRLDFKKLIIDLKKQGKTVFFSSHILADVEEICDEIAILHRGKIIEQGSPKALMGKAHQSLEELFVRSIRNA